MATSQNGWSANNRAVTQSYKIPGTNRAVRLRTGDAGYLLVHFAAWFHANIEKLDQGVLDEWGYAERTIRGSSTTLSNHASGTALDLNATLHPLAKVGTFPGTKAAKIRARLKLYDGVIRWGGDYHGRKDEMHFEINANAAAVALVARKLRAGSPPSGSHAAPTGATISLYAIKYAASGGYFHTGQKAALEDADMVAGWLGRLKIASDRDLRVWRTFIRQAQWSKAGAQYKGIVKKFQKHYGLAVDGIVGPKTSAMFRELLTHDNYRVVATEPSDVTIRYWSIKFGAGLIQPGHAMRTTDETWKDVRQFMAWARAIGVITSNYETSWVNMTSLRGHIDFAHANRMVKATVQAVQKKFGLDVDGIFGPQTGAVLKRYGYTIV